MSGEKKPALQPRGARWISFLLFIVPVLLVCALYYQQNPFVEGFEARTYDLRFKTLRGPIPPSPDIAIIAIDDKSIAALGRFPWSRVQYVRLLQKLEASKPKVILFDIFFPEVESSQADKALAEAIHKAGNVVLATTFEFDNTFTASRSTGSLPMLEREAGIAHINIVPEEDGVVRRNLLYIHYQDHDVPAMGLMAAMRTLGISQFGATPFDVQLGENENARHIPVGSDDALWINYTGNSGIYPRYSFIDVLQGNVPPEKLRGKTVFLGATALGIYDMRVTPFNANTPGVEVHAAVADNILSQRYIQRTGVQSLIDLAGIVVLGLFAYLFTARMRLPSAILAVLILCAAYVGVSYWFFLQGQWVSMVYPPLAALLSLMLSGGWRYFVLERNARQMRAMFSSYVSHKLVSQIERNPSAVRMGGDTREVTVLFTDVKGFTTFSEKHPPQVVVERLNEYLGAMVQIIQAHDGTVDKFMGDGILSYWGAPLAQPDHAEHALACALEMRKKMVELNEHWHAQGVEPFYIRGGLQSGDVVAGNIGSRGLKMEYTVIGDTVNQASRLEGAGKTYGIDFTVGDETQRRAMDSNKGIYRFRALDRVRVVGKRVPVTIYELRGVVGEMSDRLEILFAAALALFNERRWHDAEQAFRHILEEFPADTTSKLYLERCAYFKTNPPGPEWDGVFNRQEK